MLHLLAETPYLTQFSKDILKSWLKTVLFNVAFSYYLEHHKISEENLKPKFDLGSFENWVIQA